MFDLFDLIPEEIDADRSPQQTGPEPDAEGRGGTEGRDFSLSGATDGHEPLGLTERDREIVAAVLAGYTETAIAGRLLTSVQGIETTLHEICERLGVGDRLELAFWIASRRLKPPQIPN
jgi:DNA-binding NarL/FixJ family response regulator